MDIWIGDVQLTVAVTPDCCCTVDLHSGTRDTMATIVDTVCNSVVCAQCARI